jgi:hypothetical protein
MEVAERKVRNLDGNPAAIHFLDGALSTRRPWISRPDVCVDERKRVVQE